MLKVKKLLTSLIILLLSFGPLIGPLAVYAEEVTLTNEAQATTEVNSTANSGENQIQTPEPSPTPTLEPAATALPNPSPSSTPEPSSSPEPSVSLSPEPSVTPESSPSPSPEPTQITTGDSVAVTEVVNNVNSTQVNSQVVYKTLNIFLDGDIDLSDSGTLQSIVEQALTEPTDAATINVSYDGTNVAFVSNEIVSISNSGNNSIDGAGQAIINTGNAYSIVSLLNQVNTTIIDSQIYLVTINIFGDVTANIILPELTANESNDQTPCCNQDVTINNQATVSSQINSQAVSGQNTVVAATDAQIESGDAQSTVNVVNVVNTNLINTTISNLVINVLGSWIGSWLGADEWLTTGTPAVTNGCDGCLDNVTINNQALVDNQITSLASSGGNNINAQSGQIRTGKAYSSVSLFNFINTSIINSRGFWGFINIFGRLTGNVGTAAALFPEPSPTPTPTPTPEPETIASSEPASRETGGLLAIEQTNNVGEYVLPGDTVTFNVLIKNPGGGKVYDAKLWLGLVKDGENMGGGWIHVGDIESKKGVKVSTGLVLSGEAEAGEYIARAEVSGLTGPTDEAVSASADSNFLIVAFSPLIKSLATPVQASETENVLGETIAAGVTPYNWLLKLFWLLLLLLAVLKAIEKREQLGYAWAKNKSFLIAKAMAIRSLLFSLLALLKSS